MFKYTKLFSLCIPTVKAILLFFLYELMINGYDINVTKHILYLLSESPPTVHQNDDTIFIIDLP